MPYAKCRRQYSMNAIRCQCNSGAADRVGEAALCTDTAGKVAGMTEGEPDVASEKTSHNILGEPGQRSKAALVFGGCHVRRIYPVCPHRESFALGLRRPRTPQDFPLACPRWRERI